MFLKRTVFQKIMFCQVSILVVSVPVGVDSDSLSARALSDASAMGDLFSGCKIFYYRNYFWYRRHMQFLLLVTKNGETELCCS